MREKKEEVRKTRNEKLEFFRTLKLQERGITLIALVITIVILLILATVTINIFLGEDGLIQRTQQGKELTESAQAEEQEELKGAEEYINGILSEVIPQKSEVEIAKESGTPFSDTTKITDGDKNELYIPKGFKITRESANNVSDGIVISDGTNEFVWIPVDNAILGNIYQENANSKLTGVDINTSLYSKLEIRDSDTSNYISGLPNTINSREPDLLSEYDTDESYYKNILEYNSLEEMADAFVTEYKAIYNSIKTYKGFYIGRYELTGTVDNPTVKKGEKVLSAAGSQAGNWYNLKKACTKLISNEDMQTAMIYGNLWDYVMNWLIETGNKTENQIYENSTDWGNYKDSIGNAANNAGTKRNSGTNEAWKANNIYDLAGNYLEWTRRSIWDR